MLNGTSNEAKTRNDFILGKTPVVYLVTRRVSVTKLKYSQLLTNKTLTRWQLLN